MPAAIHRCSHPGCSIELSHTQLKRHYLGHLDNRVLEASGLRQQCPINNCTFTHDRTSSGNTREHFARRHTGKDPGVYLAMSTSDVDSQGRNLTDCLAEAGVPRFPWVGPGPTPEVTQTSIYICAYPGCDHQEPLFQLKRHYVTHLDDTILETSGLRRICPIAECTFTHCRAHHGNSKEHFAKKHPGKEPRTYIPMSFNDRDSRGRTFADCLAEARVPQFVQVGYARTQTILNTDNVILAQSGPSTTHHTQNPSSIPESAQTSSSGHDRESDQRMHQRSLMPQASGAGPGASIYECPYPGCDHQQILSQVRLHYLEHLDKTVLEASGIRRKCPLWGCVHFHHNRAHTSNTRRHFASQHPDKDPSAYLPMFATDRDDQGRNFRDCLSQLELPNLRLIGQMSTISDVANVRQASSRSNAVPRASDSARQTRGMQGLEDDPQMLQSTSESLSYYADESSVPVDRRSSIWIQPAVEGECKCNVPRAFLQILFL